MTIDYRAQFRTAPFHSMMLDHDLQFIDASDRFCANTGVARDDLIGRFIFDVFPGDGTEREEVEALFHAALKGQANSREKVRYSIVDQEAGDGSMKPVWWTFHNAPVFNEDGTVSHMIQQGWNADEEVRLDELNTAILREMQHRIGNVFALVSSIARQTGRNAKSMKDFAAGFDARLQALSAANALLANGNWDEVQLSDLLERELTPYQDKSTNIVMDGVPYELTVAHAQPFAMALHELATNAVKHGALAVDGGTLRVGWERVGKKGLDFHWIETGLDADIEAPSETGFGSMILTSIMPVQVGGNATLSFEDGKMSYRLKIPDTGNQA